MTLHSSAVVSGQGSGASKSKLQRDDCHWSLTTGHCLNHLGNLLRLPCLPSLE
jgi:hypothetical protein